MYVITSSYYHVGVQMVITSSYYHVGVMGYVCNYISYYHVGVQMGYVCNYIFLLSCRCTNGLCM